MQDNRKKYIDFLAKRKKNCYQFITDTLLNEESQDNLSVQYKNWNTDVSSASIHFDFKVFNTSKHFGRIANGFEILNAFSCDIGMTSYDKIESFTEHIRKEYGQFIYNLIKEAESQGATTLSSKQYLEDYNDFHRFVRDSKVTSAQKEFKEKYEKIAKDYSDIKLSADAPADENNARESTL